MARRITTLTGGSPLGAWFEHREEGRALRELLMRSEPSEDALAPLLDLSLDQLVTVSQGRLSQASVDDMVHRVNVSGHRAPTDKDASGPAPAHWR